MTKNTQTTIYAAFVKAQKAFGPALKSSTNPHFRSRYADLSACVEAVVDALNDNGIALMQRTHPAENGVAVETILVHESGETLSSGILHVPASKHDAQGYGSALTYARRYSLMATCGIAPEDDDGNAATKAAPKRVVVNTKTGEVKEEDNIPDWDGDKAKKSKIAKTLYDIRNLPEEQQDKASEYLKSHACSYNETTGTWTCPIRLEKLQSCIVEK